MKQAILLITILLFPLIALGQTAEEYYNSGVAKHVEGDYIGAIPDYSKAIELDPKYSNAYSRRASARYLLKDYGGAIQDYSKVIELNPNLLGDAWAYNRRASAKNSLEDYRGAIEDYSKAIDILTHEKGMVPKGELGSAKQRMIDTHLPAIFLMKATAQELLGDYKGMIQNYSKMIEVYPDDNAAYYLRGRRKAQLLDYRGAIQDYNKAIELTPTYAEAYGNRGIAKIALGQKDSGCLDLSKAGELGDSTSYDDITEYCN